jgi:DNA-binding HxlR family transcriptional regulator
MITDSGAFERAYVRRASLACEVLLQGKWRVEILCAMRAGPVRLGQLARLIPEASRKMLTQNLRSLEGSGVVIRRDLSSVLLHVEYDLEPGFRDCVCPLLDDLSKWGDIYLHKAIEGQPLPSPG